MKYDIFKTKYQTVLSDKKNGQDAKTNDRACSII